MTIRCVNQGGLPCARETWKKGCRVGPFTSDNKDKKSAKTTAIIQLLCASAILATWMRRGDVCANCMGTMQYWSGHKHTGKFCRVFMTRRSSLIHERVSIILFGCELQVGAFTLTYAFVNTEYDSTTSEAGVNLPYSAIGDGDSRELLCLHRSPAPSCS